MRAVYADEFPLGFLGQQTIKRASDIRFDDDTQSWGLWFFVDGEFVPPPPQYTGFSRYGEAREMEIRIMNRCMGMGVSPLCPYIVDWFGRLPRS